MTSSPPAAAAAAASAADAPAVHAWRSVNYPLGRECQLFCKDQPLQITFESKQHGKQFPSVRYVICGYAGRCSESALSNDNATDVWVREFSLATRHANPDGQIKFFRFRQITAVIGIEAGDWIRACMCEDWPRLPPEAGAVLPLFRDFGLDYTLKAKLALINPAVNPDSDVNFHPPYGMPSTKFPASGLQPAT
eukprot:SAG22_NODE_545_length_9265_cov_7.988108_5_plen_193_part_00